MHDRLPQDTQAEARKRFEGALMDREGILFVVSAPSGAGKTSLCRDVLGQDAGLRFSISHTTRPPRGEEKDGKDYFFIDEATFKEKCDRGDFIEWAKVHGQYYGTAEEGLRKWIAEGIDVLLDIDTQGALILKERFEGAVYIYILPPSFDVLKQRLIGRGSDSKEEIARRLQKAHDEIREYHQYHYLIINKEYEAAKQTLYAVILAERARIGQANLKWVEDRFIHRFEDA